MSGQILQIAGKGGIAIINTGHTGISPKFQLTLQKTKKSTGTMATENLDLRPMLALFGHPGHELLVGQLLADFNATVCWLSDGSGGAQTERSGYTRSLLADCACHVGPVHGFASDRRVYAAIMEGDVGFLDPVMEALGAAIQSMRPSSILTDPMEYFNPLHDLANTMTDILIATSAKSGMAIGKLVYANEYPEHFAREIPAVQRNLTTTEKQTQRARLDAYVPLHAEWERLEQDGKLVSLDVERLYSDPLRLDAITPASQTRFGSAYYEDYGRQAVARGIYQTSLTFAEHALPFARQLVHRHLGSTR